MKPRTASMLVTSLIVLAYAGKAQQPPPRPMPGMPADAIKRILDLSDQQVQQLTDLRHSFQQQTRELMMEAGNLARQRQALLQSGNPDPTAVGNLLIQEQGL